jgi:hypothetical protein
MLSETLPHLDGLVARLKSLVALTKAILVRESTIPCTGDCLRAIGITHARGSFVAAVHRATTTARGVAKLHLSACRLAR